MIPLLWIDVETTGLDPCHHELLEVAAILTDTRLNEVRRMHRVIRPSDEAFSKAVRRVQLMHQESGLWAECFDTGDLLADAMDELALLLDRAVQLSWDAGCGRRVQIAGSSPTFDREWILRYLTCAEDHLHYRTFDVNPLRYAAGDRKDGPRPHRAIQDLEQDLAFTRDVVRRLGAQTKPGRPAA